MLGASGAALLWRCPQAFAQAKIKIAIWEFENHADSYWFSSSWDRPRAARSIPSFLKTSNCHPSSASWNATS